MQVPLLDLKLQYQPLAAEIQAAIDKVCASQHFILGPAVRELEAGVAAYSQCRFGIGVSSGTDALLLALMALGIGPGDAVITSPFTFFATAGTVARTGARPLFCDIDPATFNLSPAALAELIDRQCERRGAALVHRASGARVRALMPVHLYGQVADMAAAHGERAGYRTQGDRGRRAGDRRGRRRRPARRQLRRRRLPVVLSRPRTSARSAMPACASPTTRRSPSVWRSSGSRRQTEVLPRPHRRQLPAR